jgi:ubiquitin-conjugating enzyme E2 O
MQLGVEEIAKQPRPHKFWSGQEMTQLTVIAGKDIPPIRLEEKVLLRNTHMAESKGIAPTSHGKKADNSGAFEVRTMVVKQPQSTLRVLWQDGTQESISSTEVVPHIVSDSYECW